jgi:hypothetical protein
MRCGFDGLSALVQTRLEQAPFSGQVFVFRGRRGDLIKLLWFDGDGLCLAPTGAHLGSARDSLRRGSFSQFFCASTDHAGESHGILRLCWRPHFRI